MPTRRTFIFSSFFVMAIAATLAFLPWDGRADPDTTQDYSRVYAVDDVTLIILMTYPPQIRIEANGTARTAGWENPRMIQTNSDALLADGIREFVFVADRPKGVTSQVVTPIKAVIVWPSPGPELRGVRVLSETNAITKTLP